MGLKLWLQKKINSKTKLSKGSKFMFYNATKIPLFHFRCDLSHIGFHKVQMCVLFKLFPSQMRWMPPPIRNDTQHCKEIRLYSLGEKCLILLINFQLHVILDFVSTTKLYLFQKIPWGWLGTSNKLNYLLIW